MSDTLLIKTCTVCLEDKRLDEFNKKNVLGPVL